MAAGDKTILDVAYVSIKPSIWVKDQLDSVLEALGLDPEMPVSELREALAVYERLKGCEEAPDMGFGDVVGPDEGESRLWFTNPADLLRWVRGEDITESERFLIENGDNHDR